jgi:hypothetical protein
MVRPHERPGESYRPVRAVSVTGTFPGFARPHFVPANLSTNSAALNTVYVQHVLDRRIVSFEALDEEVDGHTIPLTNADTVREGEEPVYVYAFGPNDAVVGTQTAVAKAIDCRFNEIEEKLFAACTAAQFAGLVNRLTKANRRAFNLLESVDPIAANSWRDTIIFLPSLRAGLNSLNVPPESARLETRKTNDGLEVTLALRLPTKSSALSKRIEQICRQSLVGTGLFRKADVFSLYVESEDVEGAQLGMLGPAELDAALKQAKFFLEEKVFLPALQSNATSGRILNVIKDTRQWISRFRKIGDLVRYMDRFRPDTRQGSLPFLEVKNLRFEDVYVEFSKKFGHFRWFKTTMADFTEGVSYDPFILSIYTRTYNNRGGGIRPVGKTGEHEAVVINIILSGGKYANEWIEPFRRLKCYLKDHGTRSSSNFEEDHSSNRSIIRYPNVPILVFTRTNEDTDFTYRGIFHYSQVATDEGGRKWFELVKLEAQRA